MPQARHTLSYHICSRAYSRGGCLYTLQDGGTERERESSSINQYPQGDEQVPVHKGNPTPEHGGTCSFGVTWTPKSPERGEGGRSFYRAETPRHYFTERAPSGHRPAVVRSGKPHKFGVNHSTPHSTLPRNYQETRKNEINQGADDATCCCTSHGPFFRECGFLFFTWI